MYFCRRPFREYFTPIGQRVRRERRYAEEHALSLVPRCLIVDTDMELLASRFGGRFGNPTTLAVVVGGVLLADFLGVGSVSIGAQLETSYLRNGHVFLDVGALRSSVFWKYKCLFQHAGLDISYPVAALSEVLTNRVVTAAADRYFVASCPHAKQDLQPCGRCYKCFRKLQLSGQGRVHPDAHTLAILDKAPLKMATSAIYAARLGGYRHPAFERHRDLDLSFLERYYDGAIEALTPRGVHAHLRRRFAELGLTPMTVEDELALRGIGQHLAPARHRPELAFPESEPEERLEG